MKRIKMTWLFIALISMIYFFSIEAAAETGIGVLMVSEQGRYADCLNGIIEELEKGGFKEPALKLTIENARDSRARLEGLVQKLAAGRMDLIIAIGTPAAIAVAREIKDIPIVFSMVYDPVEAGIVRSWRSSGNNITGSSTKFPLSKVLNILNELAQVKRLAVLYTPGEKNSEQQLLDLQKIQADFRIKILPVILTGKEDVAQTLSGVVRTVDAIYLTGSTIVGASVPVITGIANRAKVVTVSHLDDMVKNGALLGVSLDSRLVGNLAGKKAVKILKGAKPSSIPIESGKELEIILNMKAAKAGRFEVPASFMSKVNKIIE